jgi:hypothetical protein
MDYELLLTNAVSVPVDVTSVQVRAVGGGSVETLSGAKLTAATSLVGSSQETTTELPPSSAAIVWIDLTFATESAIPSRLEHRVTIEVGPGLPLGPLIVNTAARTPVAHHEALVISPPLRGGRWVAIGSVHRRSILPVGGALRLGQRFAVDFSALLDSQGRTHSGPADRNSSYFNFGRPVLAVGSGTVVQVVDGLPNQIPNANDPVPLDEADGNHVIIRLHKGVFVGYAHLMPGSIRVHRGEHVRVGQVLGKLGNSGNTSGPHLHFQLMNRPSLVDSEGLPFEFEDFRLDGRATSVEDVIEADAAGTPVPFTPSRVPQRHRQGLTNLEVMRFPG